MKEYIQKFIESICPEAPELYLSMFTEKKCLEDATYIINQLREEVKLYKESYEIQRILKEGISEANEELRKEIKKLKNEEGFLYRRSNYVIIKSSNEFLIIKDIGPWDMYLTVTNGAEEVVEELVESGMLPDRRRLLYYDSANALDEILVVDGKFAGFAPGPR